MNATLAGTISSTFPSGWVSHVHASHQFRLQFHGSKPYRAYRPCCLSSSLPRLYYAPGAVNTKPTAADDPPSNQAVPALPLGPPYSNSIGNRPVLHSRQSMQSNMRARSIADSERKEASSIAVYHAGVPAARSLDLRADSDMGSVEEGSNGRHSTLRAPADDTRSDGVSDHHVTISVESVEGSAVMAHACNAHASQFAPQVAGLKPGAPPSSTRADKGWSSSCHLACTRSCCMGEVYGTMAPPPLQNAVSSSQHAQMQGEVEHRRPLVQQPQLKV